MEVTNFSVKIQLNFSSVNTGPRGTFDLYSDLDGFVTPFEKCLQRSQLENGYVSYLVPKGTSIVRIKTVCFDCDTYIDLILVIPSPTVTPTVTKSISVTKTPTVTVTSTITPTRTVTITATPTKTVTVTKTVTPTVTVTITPSITVSPTKLLSTTPTPTLSPSNFPRPILGTRLANSSEEACYAPVVPIYTRSGRVYPGIILYFDKYLTIPVTFYNHVKLEDGTIYTLNSVTGYVGNDTGNRCKGNVPSTTPSPSDTPVPTRTPSVSKTPSISVTQTVTPSVTVTPSITPTISETPMETPTVTPTPTESPI